MSIPQDKWPHKAHILYIAQALFVFLLVGLESSSKGLQWARETCVQLGRTGGYKWTGWVWDITGWSWRLQQNYRTFHKGKLEDVNMWSVGLANKRHRPYLSTGVNVSPSAWCWSRVSWCSTGCYASFGRWAPGLHRLSHFMWEREHGHLFIIKFPFIQDDVCEILNDILVYVFCESFSYWICKH